MHKKVFLLPALLVMLITFAWAEVPATLSFFGDKYIQTGESRRLSPVFLMIASQIIGGGTHADVFFEGFGKIAVVVEADGSVYPCDFYVLDKWRMGNIKYDTVESLLGSEAAVRFVKESLSVPEDCRACPYFAICKGGCRRHRETGGETLSQNRYCAAYRSFFEKSGSLIVDMARRLCTK